MTQTTAWVPGDQLGLAIPTSPDALLTQGCEFLTAAFRASKTIAENNSVTHLELLSCSGGSTGTKAFLTVRYAEEHAALSQNLFIKFSRDFTNPIRDALKDQLQAEVKLGLLSQHPAFPIATPKCYFADYHAESGSGLLITEQITFGENGIEPAHEKCLDYELNDALGHYRAVIKSLAALAAGHKSGALKEPIERYFPFQLQQQSVAQAMRYNLEQLQRRVKRLQEFAAAAPQFLPPHLRSLAFTEDLANSLPTLLSNHPLIATYLHRDDRFIALMHWNANLDNAYFWHNQQNQIECGFLDWGNVSQMNMASALWGALSAAESDIWLQHLDELLGLFSRELTARGGPRLPPEELKFQLYITVLVLGSSWLLDAPGLIKKVLPNFSEIPNRYDPRFKRSETARTQLQMLINYLNVCHSAGIDNLCRRLQTKML